MLLPRRRQPPCATQIFALRGIASATTSPAMAARGPVRARQWASDRSKGAAWRADCRVEIRIVFVRKYLWHAAPYTPPDGSSKAEARVEERLLALLHGRSAGGSAWSLRGIARCGLNAKAAKPVRKCMNYLTKNGR